jgi:uncharacterized repeat protein (TIGR03803 family)
MTKLNACKMICGVFVLCGATAIAAPAQVFTSLVSFDGTNGANPQASLVQGVDGKFYGTTKLGGAAGCFLGCGTVFKVTAMGALNMLHSFQGPNLDDADPIGGLFLSIDGNLYGTTNGTHSNDNGTVFRMNPAGTVTTLHYFGGDPDGAWPSATLMQAANGEFYGTTSGGGAANDGIVFKISHSGTLATIYSFCQQPHCADGTNPTAGLIQATDGNFYGATPGTVFKISPGNTFTTIYTFCSKPNCADGGGAMASLIQATDGNFYGTTIGGGTGTCSGSVGCGTVFKITPGGVLTTLHSFNNADGALPYAGLVQATDGNFYGTTTVGGNSTCVPSGCGTVFQVTPDGTFTTLHNFDSTDGLSPMGGLVQSTNGNFYGTTVHGGANINCDQGCGTVYSLSVGLGPFVAFVRPYGKVGQTGGILGQGFTGTASVSLNGTPASFTVVSDTFIKATVPPGATTGFVTVVTPSGTLTSNVPFRVLP